MNFREAQIKRFAKYQKYLQKMAILCEFLMKMK
jgi:hypothetical protein